MDSNEKRVATLDLIRQRKVAYQLVFGHEGGTAVIDDLKRFCRAEDSCFHPDPRNHAVLEGRRQVWLRIERHLKLSIEGIAHHYYGFAPSTGDRDDE